MDYVVEAMGQVWRSRENIRGLRIVEAPAFLRHFTARFEPVGEPAGAGANPGVSAGNR
jgi:tryptophanase